MPPFRPVEIARWFINATDRESGDDITHLKVQKLLYYAQGWHLAHFDEPLFNEEMEAWAHGPVEVSVWESFRGYGFNSIPEQENARRFDDRTRRLLVSVDRKYGIYTAKRLERMTHQEPPWLRARGDLPPDERCNEIVSKSEMKRYFNSLRAPRA
jgi:uncharacterized phage-associated protein